MPGLRINVNSPILPIYTLNLNFTATSLESSKKWVRSVIYDKILNSGENAMQIGPVDHKVSLLEVYFKKEINASRT